MRTAAFALLMVSWAMESWGALPAAPGPPQEREFTQLSPIVAVDARADADLLAAAKEIAAAMGDKIAVVQVHGNPVCCVWIELNHWGEPNPGKSGYVILNQPGGSVISVSNKKQLKEAVARFKESIRKKDGNVEVPVGIMTNYPIVHVR